MIPLTTNNFNRMKIVILDGYTVNPGDLSWGWLEDSGDCEIYDRSTPDETIERSNEAEAVFTNKVIFSREVIEKLPGLKYIGVLATGYNVVDLKAASEAGIVVTNIPAYSTMSVAQMVLSHILHQVQNISLHSVSVQKGEWSRSLDFSYHITPQIELAGKTLGIIGFGQIGQSVARLGLALGMKILFNNRSVKRTTINSKQVDLETLLEESDIISINCPLTKENEGFINRHAIDKMKRSAILINTGRGPLINETDLAEALNGGRIAGAGLDVLSSEPPSPGNPLFKAKNCYITPHIAWATKEARARLIEIATDNLKAFINGEPQNVVI